ncbi:O-antigen ligase family protein [Candidatus Gottesmanbacteria bacterium]|nr:O-antigen ligase family protein [Candidatus Gottesmanbacteria bacterium]
MKATTFLFYLLLALLPTQLGRHFFFDFSLLNGIRSDYLAPTIYITDIIIISMVLTWLIERKIQHQNSNDQNSKLPHPNPLLLGEGKWVRSFKHLNLFRISDFGFRISIFIIGYLLFTSIFVASNQFAALYKLVKIVEFILLGWVIVRIRPNLLTVLTVLSFSVFYSSLIAFGQYILQRSVGGLLWFLGERNFYSGTPGIAAVSFNGGLTLRSYATFPHPNVLGGFLAVVLPLLLAAIFNLYKIFRKIHIFWFLLSILVGFITLIITFSRAAWLTAFLGFFLILLNRKKVFLNWLKNHQNLTLIIFYGLIFFSVVTPLLFPKNSFMKGESWEERSQLTNATLSITLSHPYIGVGLNNFIVQVRPFINLYSGIYQFQPVHNIYLLIFAETGLIGFLLFLFFQLVVFRRSISTSYLITFPLIQLFLLGLFDHYLFTLQQGQLMFVIFASLALIPRRV